MKTAHALCICIALVATSEPLAAQTIVQEPSISADAAQELAATALAYCRKEGHKVSITILDRSGRTKVALRDDGAAPHSFEHSLRKAYTALTYNMPSGEYGKRAAANPGAIGPQLLANITTAAGGLPIRAGNDVVGAVGVSGTPGSAGGGEADAKCGQAGIDHLAKGLVPAR
ncbi:MAG: GlcG/HbpS family heme-binding protein [Burkholderiales bacterium]